MGAKFWREQFSLRAIVHPPLPAALAVAPDFVAAALFCLLAGWLGDRIGREAEDWFTWSALGAYAVLLVLARITGSLGARVLGRDAAALSIATTVVAVCGLALPLIDLYSNPVFGEIDPDYGFGILWLVASPLCAIALLLSFRNWAPQSRWWQRLLAGFVLPLLALHLVERSDTWSSFYYSDTESYEAESVVERADAHLDYAAEDLLAMQDALVDAQLAQLLPQRPGKVDLYLLALAGDAAEDVFRNEVDAVETLFDQRFDTGGRSLSLINHVDTLPQVPMATLRNLRRTLEGLGRIVDAGEDIVFVFMTSHGSEDHQWQVQLGDLSLTPVEPDDLIEAYDNAGIRWRVSVISACYSGGYIDALAAPSSLVITAARADRTSFGCGADADLTYFGRAYFVEALRQTDDFIAAHGLAAARIRSREAAEGYEHSEPQISVGSAIAPQLTRWRRERQAAPILSLNR